MTKLIQDIKSTGISSAYFEAPFDKAKAELEKQNYEIISLEDNARLRISQGEGEIVSQNGNWVKEGVIYILKKGRFFTPNSPVLEQPDKATDAHRKNKEYFVTNEQIEKALENSVQVPYNLNPIPTDWFGKEPITDFCFGKSAKDYGLFLKKAGINEMPLWLNNERYVNSQKESYANQLWFNRLDYRSGLVGNSWYLDYSGRLRGVCKDAEGVASQNLVSYEKIEKALNELGFSGLKENLIDKLKQ